MKNTKIAKKAFDEIERHIDLYIELINAGTLPFSYCYPHICGMISMCYELGFLNFKETTYLTAAINSILPVNLKAEHK